MSFFGEETAVRADTEVAGDENRFFCGAEIFLGRWFPQCVTQMGQNTNPKLSDAQPDIFFLYLLHYTLFVFVGCFLECLSGTKALKRI